MSHHPESFGRLVERLHLEPDEVAVFSLALVEIGGRWELHAGSVLFGPKEMSQVAWTDWSVDESGHRHFTDVYGIHPAHPPTFSVDHGSWRLIRFALAQPDALNLIRVWVETGVAKDGAGPGEHVYTNLAIPGAPGAVLTGSSGLAAQLCLSACRPVTGWVHPCPDLSADDLPTDWKLAPAAAPCDAARFLLGIGSITEQPRGLLVGRLTRSAWIADMRATPPAFDDFTVTIGLSPDRQSLWDLVVDLEEVDRDGHLLTARRLRLADLRLPAAGMTRYDVTFPSSGTGLTRKVRLYGLDGHLFDGDDNVHLAERIVTTFHLPGSTEPVATVQVGDPTHPSLTQRLDDLERSDRAYTDVLQAGLSSRVIVNRSGGSRPLRERLAAARGELRIVDPYFGVRGTLWEILDDVTVPIRIITGRDLTQLQVPPLASAPNAPSIEIRYVSQSRSLFHDRSYTWAGGGVSVGASANGLDSSALYLMEALSPVVVDDVTTHFTRWWHEANLFWRRP